MTRRAAKVDAPTRSELEQTLESQLRGIGIMSGCRPEYQFASPRRWRFDFAWPNKKIAVEVEGATWAQGRHTRGAGFEKDCEKYNAAAELGWKVFRYTSNMVYSGEAITQIERVL